MSYKEFERQAEKHAVDHRVARGRMPDGTVGEVVSFLVEKPQGKVNVQLRDDSDRLVHDETKENFVSRQWAICARSWQYHAWGMTPAYSRTDPQDAAGAQGITGLMPIMFPNDWIACWNDGSAEDPANEHMIKTDGQGIVACAYRQQWGSPTGTRGQVNPDESSISNMNFVHSLVFDWATSQGVGTFQSVGWTAISPLLEYANGGAPMIRASIEERRWIVSSGLDHLTVFASNYVSSGHGSSVSWGLNASGDLVLLAKQTSSTNIQMVTISEGQWWDSMPSRGPTGAILKNIGSSYTKNSNTGNFASISTSSLNNAILFLGEYDNHYWIASWSSTASSMRFARMNKTSMAIDRSVQFNHGVSLVSTAIGAGTIIGSNLYICGPELSPQIRRYDLTQNPPVETATISVEWPSWMPSNMRRVHHMTNDGTDLILTYGVSGTLVDATYPSTFTARHNTSGTLLQSFGLYSNGELSRTQTVVFPSIGTVNIRGLCNFEPLGGNSSTSGGQAYSRAASRAGIPTNEPAYGHTYGFQQINLRGGWGVPSIGPSGWNTTYPIGFFWKGGRLWSATADGLVSGTSGATFFGYAEAGWNLGSRVLLDSPISKSASQTMKIRYETTFPGLV